MITDVIITGLGLGVGLAMDAFAVSMTNGLKENKMKLPKILLIALTFGVFQGAMPLIGYFVGNALYSIIYKLIPYIALFLLSFLGIKMIVDSIEEQKHPNKEEKELNGLTLKVLFVQAIATSIDALSTGITFSNYKIIDALLVALLIAVVTTILCIIACFIGKKFGDKFASYSGYVGGVILIIIGIKIFLKGIL